MSVIEFLGYRSIEFAGEAIAIDCGFLPKTFAAH